MNNLHRSSYAYSLVVTIAIIVVLWFVYISPIWHDLFIYTMDDSFITFRYGDNLATYGTLSWNPKDSIKVEGYTSILWVLISAALSFFTIDHVFSSKIISTTLVLITSILITLPLHIQRASFFWIILAIGLFFMNADVIIPMISGMETALAMLLSTSFFLTLRYVSDEPKPANTLLLCLIGLLCSLNRPEFNIAIICSVGYLFLSQRDKKKTLLLYCLIPYMIGGSLYMLWRYIYFGQLLPLPFYLKMSHKVGLSGLSDVASFLASIAFLLPLIIWPLISCKNYRAWLPVVASILSLLIFFLFPMHIMGVGHRFLIPLFPFIVLLAVLGAKEILKKYQATLGRSVLVSILLTGFIISYVYLQIHERTNEMTAIRNYGQSLQDSHVKLGKALTKYADRGYTIALGDAGAIPFYSKWKVTDTFGLNNLEIAIMRSKGFYDPMVVFKTNPDLLIFISSKCDTFTPLLDYEQLLLDDALRREFRLIGVMHFNDDYFLHVFSKPTSALEDVATNLAKEGIFDSCSLHKNKPSL